MKFKKWANLIFKDEIPEPEESLLSPEFFRPPTLYNESDITPNLIIHNHLATQDAKLNMIGYGLEKIWVKMRYHDALLSVIKKIMLMVVGSAIAYATSHYWFPLLEGFASGRLP